MSVPVLDDAARRILIVEDDPQLRATFDKWLRAAGHETRAVESGEAAVVLLMSWPPDLVLLDLGLADAMDGFDVLRVIRERHPRVRVVIVTARSADESQIRGLDLGADDYVIKSTPQRVMMARLSAQLRRTAPRIERYRMGGAFVDLTRRILIQQDVQYSLSDLEVKLLQAMSQAPQGTLSYRVLLVTVWSWPEAPRLRVDLESSPVDSLAKRLNRKFGGLVLRTLSTDKDMLLVVDGEMQPVLDDEAPPTARRHVRPGRPTTNTPSPHAD
jgi:two-component system KDP operon response regulator KdpE